MKLEQEKKKKVYQNLLFFLSFSCSMIFAGLISAYIVSSQDMYWVIFKPPMEFWMANGVLILSSLSFYIGVQTIKKNKKKQTIVSLLFTFLFGISFAYFQYAGYIELYNRGLAFSSNIISPSNELDLFGIASAEEKPQNITLYLSHQDQKLYANGNLSAESVLTSQAIFGQRIVDLQGNSLQEKLNTSTLRLLFEDGFFYNLTDHERIFPLNKHRLSPAGFILPKGEYGKDYSIRKQHERIIYSDTQFFLADDLAQKEPLNTKIAAFKNNSSAYIFVMIILHILHLFVALCMLIYLLWGLAKNKYSSENWAGIWSGAYFWHFLAILWIILFLFLFYFYQIDTLF